ncbi:EPIDERMAL PATTERNING FACTOR-like protein 4 [Linum perenne]
MMMAVHRHRIGHFLLLAAAFTFLFFLFSNSSTTHAQLGSEYSRYKRNSGSVKATLLRMGGPGSWPPTCRSKCGGCGPCKPVHVPVQPGVSFPLEYYPEAWRCKCGNKLFMP